MLVVRRAWFGHPSEQTDCCGVLRCCCNRDRTSVSAAVECVSMLTLNSQHHRRDCQSVCRRSFLQAGTLGLGGLTLPWLLQQRALANSTGRSFVRDKSIVLVFLSGGPSHIETFHPNSDAPLPYSSVTGAVKTSVVGMDFGGTFPQLARFAREATLVRSFTHPIGGHVQAIRHVLSGGTDASGENRAGYSLGGIYSRIRGTNHETTGLPTSVLLTGPEVDGQYRSERGRVQRGSSPGQLGSGYAPFEPGGRGPAVDNMQLTLDRDRFTSRRQLLRVMDQLQRQAERTRQTSGHDRFRTQATELLLKGASQAFDLSQESPRSLARYDTSGFQVGKKQFRPADIGTQFLTARRLIEAGCGFVTLHTAGWDMHADGNNPGIHAGMEMLGRPLDQALSAFLEDLQVRSMLDDVLVIVTGDFGRTPRINSRGGRDHWTRLCTLGFFGGGIGRGEVVGQTDRTNSVPSGTPVTTGNLLATVVHTLFDVSKLRLDPTIPPELSSLIQRDSPIVQL